MDLMRQLARRLNIVLYGIDRAYYCSKQYDTVSEAELCLMYALDDGAQHSQKQICCDWLIPRTTLNSIIKRWERQGYLQLESIPGRRREMAISLTGEGRKHAEKVLRVVYSAEEKAIQETVERYSPEFVDALEYYRAALSKAFCAGEKDDMENTSSEVKKK